MKYLNHTAAFRIEQISFYVFRIYIMEQPAEKKVGEDPSEHDIVWGRMNTGAACLLERMDDQISLMNDS